MEVNFAVKRKAVAQHRWQLTFDFLNFCPRFGGKKKSGVEYQYPSNLQFVTGNGSYVSCAESMTSNVSKAFKLLRTNVVTFAGLNYATCLLQYLRKVLCLKKRRT